MRKGLNPWIVVLVVAAAIVVGFNVGALDEFTTDVPTEKTPVEKKVEAANSYERYKSDGLHEEEEQYIKEALDSYMYENFSQYYQTSWYNSVSGTGTAINKHGKTFIVQSKSDAHNSQAEQFVGAVNGFFSARTTEAQYLVDRIILVDKDFQILKETETIKW